MSAGAISIIDLITQSELTIGGSTIGFPSEYIPREHLWFSPDGSQIYYVDVAGIPGSPAPGCPPACHSFTVYSANTNGGEPTRLGTVQGRIHASPAGGKIAYLDTEDPPHLWVAQLDGTAAVSVAEVDLTGTFAWQPQP